MGRNESVQRITPVGISFERFSFSARNLFASSIETLRRGGSVSVFSCGVGSSEGSSTVSFINESVVTQKISESCNIRFRSGVDWAPSHFDID